MNIIEVLIARHNIQMDISTKTKHNKIHITLKKA